MYKPHPKLSSMISGKKLQKALDLYKKNCRLFANVNNKLKEICISSDINKLINFENTFWKLLFNQFSLFPVTDNSYLHC